MSVNCLHCTHWYDYLQFNVYFIFGDCCYVMKNTHKQTLQAGLFSMPAKCLTVLGWVCIVSVLVRGGIQMGVGVVVVVVVVMVVGR